jgi:hypothetical protein
MKRVNGKLEHEEDCACFGDPVKHSKSCKNCTCQKRKSVGK